MMSFITCGKNATICCIFMVCYHKWLMTASVGRNDRGAASCQARDILKEIAQDLNGLMQT